MLIFLTLALALSTTAQSTSAKPPSGYQCGTLAGWWEIQTAYSKRSVSIIEAALANDRGRLERLVAREVPSTFYQYDNGLGVGSGARGVIELVRKVAPRRYIFFSTRGLPPPGVDPCKKTRVAVVVESSLPDNAKVLMFDYDGGKLVKIDAEDANLVTGEFSRTHTR